LRTLIMDSPYGENTRGNLFFGRTLSQSELYDLRKRCGRCVDKPWRCRLPRCRSYTPIAVGRRLPRCRAASRFHVRQRGLLPDVLDALRLAGAIRQIRSRGTKRFEATKEEARSPNVRRERYNTIQLAS